MTIHLRMPNGEIKKQEFGIPMGDPLSPGMTIGTCAWMEDEWMQTLKDEDKRRFRAKRFMDDILLLYTESPGWDAKKFVDDFTESTCYQKPLKLEEGKPNTFLETRFELQGGYIKHKLKNDNENGVTEIWRYQHFQSDAPFMQKRATLTACLRKVHQMADNPERLREGATDKLKEFIRLKYPKGLLKKACSFLAASSGEKAWLDVRDRLGH